MKPIYEAWFCQIELTNLCAKECRYCTRFVRHLRKDQLFSMSLENLAAALDSLDGWPNRIGIIGGEPTLHPQFQDACMLLQRRYPRDKYGLWTSGGPRFERFRDLIDNTFGFISYNEHTIEQQQKCKHQPNTISVGDVVADAVLRKELIDNCRVQEKWCPSISPKGAFFCEIACSLDVVLDGPGGWPIEWGWWDKTPDQFQDQVDCYCHDCGMCVPLEREYAINFADPWSAQQREKVSAGLLAKFRARGLRKFDRCDIEVFGHSLTSDSIEAIRPGWCPENYREDIYQKGGNVLGEDKNDSWLINTADFSSAREPSR